MSRTNPEAYRCPVGHFENCLQSLQKTKSWCHLQISVSNLGCHHQGHWCKSRTRLVLDLSLVEPHWWLLPIWSWYLWPEHSALSQITNFLSIWKLCHWLIPWLFSLLNSLWCGTLWQSPGIPHQYWIQNRWIFWANDSFHCIVWL